MPIEPLALLIAVEVMPDIFRTLGNVTWDVAVTAAVAGGERAEASRPSFVYWTTVRLHGTLLGRARWIPVEQQVQLAANCASFGCGARRGDP